MEVGNKTELMLFYCSLLARRAFRSSALAAAAFARRRVEVGMVRAAPAAGVRTSPPAAVKEAAVIGFSRKIGCAEAETRQTARVKAIKPCEVELLHHVAG